LGVRAGRIALQRLADQPRRLGEIALLGANDAEQVQGVEIAGRPAQELFIEPRR